MAVPNDVDTVINYVREARTARHLTQDELGILAEVNRRTIQNIEHGSHSTGVGTALRISRALAVPVEDLFTLAD